MRSFALQSLNSHDHTHQTRSLLRTETVIFASARIGKPAFTSVSTPVSISAVTDHDEVVFTLSEPANVNCCSVFLGCCHMLWS